MVLTVERRRHAEGEGGLEGLYRAHAPEALRLAYLLTGERPLAEDLVQDAFVKVLGRFHDLRNRDAFWWYLRRTIVNLARSQFRRRRVERAWFERQRPDEGVPAGDDLAERDRLQRALMTLRPEQRAAIVLRYYEDQPEDAIAVVLRCRPGTVRSLISRGVATLRAELGPAAIGGDDG